jgi:hypothetical protein
VGASQGQLVECEHVRIAISQAPKAGHAGEKLAERHDLLSRTVSRVARASRRGRERKRQATTRPIVAQSVLFTGGRAPSVRPSPASEVVSYGVCSCVHDVLGDGPLAGRLAHAGIFGYEP